MLANEAELFSRVVALRIQKDRARDARRQREHSAQRLTWVSSQQSQPEEPQRKYLEERTEEDEVEETSVELLKLARTMDRAMVERVIEAKRRSDDLVTFLRGIFDVSPAKAADGVNRSIWMFESILRMLGAGEELARTDDVVAELLLRVSSLADTVVALLAERALDFALGEGLTPSVQSKQATEGLLEVLCKLVFRLSPFPRGLIDPDRRCKEDFSDMDGEAFQIFVVTRVCRSHWRPTAIVPLITALRELSARSASFRDEDILNMLERKALRQMSEATNKDLPELLTQLLAFSSLFPDRKRTIEALVCHFERLETEASTSAILGDVLVRFCTSASQDANIGTSIMKLMEDRRIWSVTSVSFLLALGKVKRFEKTVIEFVRKRAVDQAEAKVRSREAPWLASITELCHPQQQENCDDSEMYIVLCRICTNAQSGGWDLLIPSLVKLGVRLADEHDSLSLSAHVQFDLLFEPAFSSTARALVGEIGVRLLARCFRQFPLARADLLAEVVNRALISEGGRGALPFLRLLFLISQDAESSRALFADHPTEIKDLITLLPSISPRIAHGLLRGLAPAINQSSPYRGLRDHAMVVFRKALFQRDVNPRFIALFGILTCCNVSSLALSTSASTVGSNEDSLRDAVGCLRRCLSQQIEIRTSLYMALKAFPPSFRADLLLSHFNNTLLEPSGDTDLAPLRFDACVEPSSGNGTEAIAPLLRTLCFPDEVFNFASLVDRMGNASLSTFSLDKNSCLDPSVVIGKTNRTILCQVVETCEVLIDTVVTRNTAAENKAAILGDVASLYRVQRALRRLVVPAEPCASDAEMKKKAAKKVKVLEGEEEEDAEPDKDENKLNSKKPKKSAKSDEMKEKRDAALDMLRLPAEGSWLSSDALLRLLKYATEVSTNTMYDVLIAPPASNRRDVPSFLSSTSFHAYLMSAANVALKQLSRYAVQVEDISPLMKSRAASSGIAMLSSTRLNVEMAENCAGAQLVDVISVCRPLAKSLFKLMNRYTNLETMIRSKSGENEPTATEHQLQQKKGKKRKSDDPSSVSTDSTDQGQAKRLAEVGELLDSLVENIRDILVVAGRISKPALSCVVKDAFKQTNLEATDDEHLNDAARTMLNICADAFARKRYRTATTCLDAIRCLLLPLPVGSPFLDAHVDSLAELINGYEVKAGPLIKTVFKLFLDLSNRAKPDELGMACNQLAQGFSAEMNYRRKLSEKAVLDLKRAESGVEESNDEQLDSMLQVIPRMIRGSACCNTAVTVLVQHLSSHGLEECEKVVTAFPEIYSKTEIQNRFLQRMESIFAILGVVIQNNIPAGTVFDLISRCIIRAFKCCIKFLKGCTTRKSVLGQAALGVLVMLIYQKVSPSIDSRLRDLEAPFSKSSDAIPAAKGSKKGKELQRESKTVPEMVFHIEQYEAVLAKAAKACAGIEGLAKYVRRMTARDFRIYSDQVKKALDREEEAEEAQEE